MISPAVRRLAASLGLKVDEPRTTAMAPYRDPKTSSRTAVLRPKDPALALRRLKEWNDLMDRALDGVQIQGSPAKREADVLWVTMKKEQQWTFLGWLTSGAKTAVDDTGRETDLSPGDLHELEHRLAGWR